MRTIIRKYILALAILFMLFGIILSLLFLSIYPFQYTTTDLADYGHYIGNVDNEAPKELISSFFPGEIDPSFTDVRYSYRANKGDTYAFEVYLEFSIKDKNEYTTYVSRIIADKETQIFSYDPDYLAYYIANDLHPVKNTPRYDNTNEPYINIHCADIRTILFSDKEQKIIYVALGVFDGGLADTRFLTVFFDRFEIDPLEYARNASPEYF